MHRSPFSYRGFRAVLLSALLTGFAHAGERRNVAAAFSADAFERHVEFLADDALQGRGIGTTGIAQAGDYIAERFTELGVEPAGDKGTFFQNFTVSVSSRISDSTRLAWRGDDGEPRRRLKLNEQYVPLPFSKREAFDGEVAFVGYGIDEDDQHAYNDYDGLDVRGRVVLMLRYEPAWWAEEPVDEQTPEQPARAHARHAFFTTKAEHALRRGARAVLIVDARAKPGAEGHEPFYTFAAGRGPTLDLPMVQISQATADAMLKSADLPPIARLVERIDQRRRPCSALLHGVRVNGVVAIAKEQTPVRNVIGVVRGKGPRADEYVVIGAHFDHLGKTRNFRRPNDTNEYIHNGADDNASGTSGLILIADALRRGDPLGRSVLLMAFTAEESGLLGSKHWVDNPSVPLEKVVAMLNMDMIGRLKDEKLQVGGMNTGSGFADRVARFAKEAEFALSDGGGGRGPSDHSSFYGKNIPVLFFFTGMHRQYHQPEDDTPLINNEGGARIARMVYDCLVEIADAKDRPEFKKDASRFRPQRQQEEGETSPGDRRPPRDEPPARPARNAAADAAHAGGEEGETPPMPRVRLGVAPGNYGEAEGRGMPIDFVVEGGPAAKAGIRDGDRILKIGDREITDVYSFMNALSKYKPGDEVDVVVLRDGKEKTIRVKLEAGGRGSQQPRE